MWFIVCVCASESITKNDVIKKKFLFDLANYQQHMIWIHPMTRENGDMPSQFLSAAILVVLSDDNVENSDVLKHRFKNDYHFVGIQRLFEYVLACGLRKNILWCGC